MDMEVAVGLFEGMIDPIMQFITNLIGVIVEFIVGIIHGTISSIVSLFTREFLINGKMFENSLVNLIFQWSKDNLVVIAGSLMILIAMWQIFKTFFSFAGLYGEMEEPWKIGLKVMLFGIMLTNSIDICKYLVANPISKVMELIFNTNIDVTSGKITGVTYGMDIFEITDPTNYVSFTDKNLLVTIASAVIVIFVDWQMLLFMLDIAQKYVNMIFYILISPIAFAFGVSKATSDILKKWSKLFAGGVAIQGAQILILQLINVYSRLLPTSTGKNMGLLFIYMTIGMLIGKVEEILGDLDLPSGPKFDMGIGEIQGTIWQAIQIGRALRDDDDDDD